MKRIFSILFLTTFVYCLFFFPSRVLAQDTGWVIEDFMSDLAIKQDGQVRVVETIKVDFYALEKHGIYRDLPYVYDNNGKREYSKIVIEGINRDGEAEKYEKSNNENNIRIRIGDANKTISGKHTYTIIYRDAGVLRGYADHDELYWNVTGNEWPVPIQKVSAFVRLPLDGLQKATCFQGVVGSTVTCNAEVTSPQSADFASSSSLNAYEGMSVVAGFQKGLVPLLVIERPKTFLEKLFAWPSLMTLLSVIFFGIFAVFILWLRFGRDYWFINRSGLVKGGADSAKPIGAHETIVVEYESPEKLRPAVLGVLMDERADTLDVVATIIDLASRGYLTIHEVKKTWLFGSTDYRLERTKNETTELLAYESELLKKIFGGKETVLVSSLKTTFYEDLKKIKQMLYEQVVRENLFSNDPEKVRTKYIGIGVLIVVLAVVGIFWSVHTEIIYLSDICIGIFVTGILLMIAGNYMPRRSANGREMYRRVRGYRLFIATAEKHRQQFFEKKNLFNEVLPYAIVFGLTGKFAQAMKDIGLSQKAMTPSWYYGLHPFSLNSFDTSINDFSNSLSSAIASAPKSSGFSSGGGFSGGGFGGGGGGSW